MSRWNKFSIILYCASGIFLNHISHTWTFSHQAQGLYVAGLLNWDVPIGCAYIFSIISGILAGCLFLFWINADSKILPIIWCVSFLILCQTYSRGFILFAFNFFLILTMIVRKWLWQNYCISRKVDEPDKALIHNELLALFRVCFQYLAFIVATMGIAMLRYYSSQYLPETGSGEMVGYVPWWHAFMIIFLGLGIFFFNLVPLYKLMVQYRSR